MVDQTKSRRAAPVQTLDLKFAKGTKLAKGSFYGIRRRLNDLDYDVAYPAVLFAQELPAGFITVRCIDDANGCAPCAYKPAPRDTTPNIGLSAGYDGIGSTGTTYSSGDRRAHHDRMPRAVSPEVG